MQAETCPVLGMLPACTCMRRAAMRITLSGSLGVRQGDQRRVWSRSQVELRPKHGQNSSFLNKIQLR